MAKIRGLSGFESLWERRSAIEAEEGSVEVLSLPDLVIAKETQRSSQSLPRRDSAVLLTR